MKKVKKINIAKTVNDAFTGFKRWWIPFCIIAGIIFFSQSWLPHFLYRNLVDTNRVSELINILSETKNKILISGDFYAAVNYINEALYKIYSEPATMSFLHLLFLKLSLILLIIALLLCFLFIIIIIMSKKSVFDCCKGKSIKDDMRRTFSQTLSYMLLCLIKAGIFLLPFLFPVVYVLIRFILPSVENGNINSVFYYMFEISGIFILAFCLVLFTVYLYIRFYFTGFVIIEKTANPLNAIVKSWKLTKFNSSRLFIIFLLTLIIDIISIITIIGFIPGMGIKYTLRASAYKQCLEIEEYNER